ncbi:hypothetical protein CR51_35685 [Caballeronia megalochromosomata]|nr:hypothetical protein CR51_35685 [Caballeronia megalochromosomata]
MSGHFGVGDLLAEQEHAFAFAPTKLFVTGDYAKDLDAGLIEQIKKETRSLDGFELVTDPKQSDLQIYVLRPKYAASGKAVLTSNQRIPISDRRARPEAWVISPQNELLNKNMITRLDNPVQGIQATISNLRKFAWARQVRELDTPGHRPSLTLRVTLLRPLSACATTCEYLADDLAKTSPYKMIGTFDIERIRDDIRLGDVLTFDLKSANDSKNHYIYIFDVSPNASIGTIFPVASDNEDAARLPAGATWNVGTKQVLKFDDEGIETIKIIESSQPIDPRLIEQPIGYVQKGDSKPLNQLERLLKTASTGNRSVESHSVGDWSTLEVNVDVHKN